MIDADPTSAVTALRANLLNEVKNAAQAAKQANERDATDRTSNNVKPKDSGDNLNTAAGSGDPYRGKTIDTTA